MNKILFSILLMHAFSQTMERVDVFNAIQKRSNDTDNSVSYTFFWDNSQNNTKKCCVKQNNHFALSLYDDYKDEWRKIEANPIVLAQGFKSLADHFEGKPTEKLPDIFLINKSDVN